MKKTLSIILSLIMALSAFSVMPFSAFALSGEGTSENPYQIGTAEELKAFRDIVNGGENAACAVLTADIDLENEAWTPIGSNSKAYIGTFDGQSYTISGLKVDISSSGNVYAGLFGYVGNWQSGGTVKCVYVNGSVSAVSTASGAYAGGVVGLNYKGTVCNCTFTGAVSAKGRDANVVAAGGIVGENFDKVDGCLHVGGNVSATADATSASAGGVVGANIFGSMRCSAHTGGTVTATVTGDGEACAGGVAGESYNNANIQYCFSTGSTVTATHTDTSRANVGGVVGRNTSTLSNCYYDSDKATDVTAVGTDTGTTTNVSGLTSTQFKNAASFPGWDFDTVWYMGADCPQLWALSSHVSTWTELTAALNKGDGIVLTVDVTPENPYWADALTVPSGVTATLDLNGHKVDRGFGANTEAGFDGSVIKISGTLTLIDSAAGGAITGGFNDQYGGGVQILGGTFNMQGGSITGNSAGKNGFFGTEGLGGGVYMQSGTFNMSGGTITGNKALGSNTGTPLGRGGGVYITEGTFNFTEGKISGNDAGAIGGGVYLASTYSGHDGIINVSGNATVKDNTVGGAVSNVYLEEGGVITVTDTLTGAIGITMQTPGVFTSGLDGNGTISNFMSDNADYHVSETAGGEAQLAAHSWGTDWSKNGTNHWYECTDCGAKKDEAPHSYGNWTPVDDTNHKRNCADCDFEEIGSHTFGATTYTWSADNSQATAKHTCSTCTKEVSETVNTTSLVTIPATCTENEVTTYTATFTKAGFETQTKDVETANALDHAWGEPTYVWSADLSQVTATRICTRDASHKNEETVNVTVNTTSATCTEQGTIIYTATFTNSAFEAQLKTVNIDALNHNYGEPTYEWTQENGVWKCTAKRVCARDASHIETETVEGAGAEKEPATCTENGTTTYTATFTNTAFEQQTKDVDDIPALTHDYQSVVTPPTCTEQGYTTYTCTRGDDEYKDDYVDALGHKYGAEGDERFTCTVCGAVDETLKAEAEKADKEAADKAAAEEKAAKEKAAAEFVAGVNGTSKTDKVKVKWGKVKGADRYVIYATYCGKKNKYKKIATVKGNITKYDITKLNGKKLNPKKNVKVYVVAQKKVKGKYKTLFKTPTFHIAGAKSKYSNVKKITVKKNKYTLKVGKTAKIKAKIVLAKKNKKAIAHVKKFRYKSTNTAVVKVDKNGKIKAIGKGTATVYVYSNNGTAKAIRITVK